MISSRSPLSIVFGVVAACGTGSSLRALGGNVQHHAHALDHHDPEGGGVVRTLEESTERLNVVYVEDDERLGGFVAQYLTSHGLDVSLVARGDLAVAEVLRVRPDVVLLDLMLRGRDGMDVCRALRERTDVPIIMVTARSEEADRVIGLEGGADDYVPKPFSTRELLARIRAQARRAKVGAPCNGRATQ